jgi:hypothetical protein
MAGGYTMLTSGNTERYATNLRFAAALNSSR